MTSLVAGRCSERLDPALVYEQLSARPSGATLRDPFIGHVFACALAMAIHEAATSGETVGSCLGLARRELRRLVEIWAPSASSYVVPDRQPERIFCDEEEDQLRQLLERYRVDSAEETSWLVSIVARRSMSPQHLWQDLGLLGRAELSRLIAERFPGLAARNSSNMKWKKFFYRSLCELEGFILCAAPTCRECGDFFACFGDEAGESALARIAHEVAPNR